ncbi:N-acetylmuramoyl-L-alanine amidase [Alkalihalobacillus deserti]|uniref:N-acetylmuramoyl-L-alanine amidase n=1 Tax=Alkalihalobacillus deserti TaxID=2879466 RepID=UPI001D142E27|nr:N-acetylmuramoyl-L-alanine amidase [Alkalihalobacillus deserti]
MQVKKVLLVTIALFLFVCSSLSTLTAEASTASVSQARSQIQQAERMADGLWNYFRVSNVNQVTYSSAFESQYNGARNSINQAQTTLNRLGSSAEKNNLQQRLNAAEATRLYAAHFIDATKQGELLLTELAKFNQTINRGNISEINDLYDDFTSQIRRVEMHVGKVYGGNNRTVVGNKFIRPAKIAHERTIYEVSQYRLMEDIKGLISKGNTALVESELAKLTRLNRRAIEIKQAGGYAALPTKVNNELKQLEQSIRNTSSNGGAVSSGGQAEGTITASSLNVRSQPSTSGTILGSLSQNQKIDIIAIDGKWVQFVYNSQTAYIHVDFILFGNQTDVGQVTATTLNIRSQPNASSKQVGSVTKGNYVQIYQEIGDWLLIKFGTSYGFISKAYVSRGIPNESGALAGRTIALDAGHGGQDPGAVAFGVQEKDVVLSVGLLLEERLLAAGANVIMTRKNDTFIDLADRSKIANDAKSNIFLSLHANAAGVESAHGTETYWNANHSSAESKELAEKIQKRLIQALDTRDRGAKEGNFSVIRNSTMPSVLVELGFVTNENEAKRLAQQSFQRDAAEAIYLGILDFYQNR